MLCLSGNGGENFILPTVGITVPIAGQAFQNICFDDARFLDAGQPALFTESEDRS